MPMRRSKLLDPRHKITCFVIPAGFGVQGRADCAFDFSVCGIATFHSRSAVGRLKVFVMAWSTEELSQQCAIGGESARQEMLLHISTRATARIPAESGKTRSSLLSGESISQVFPMSTILAS